MFAKTLIKNYLSIKYVYINYIVKRIFIKYIAIPEKKLFVSPLHLRLYKEMMLFECTQL